MTDTLRPARDAAPRMLSYEDDRASYAPEVPERFNPVLAIVERWASEGPDDVALLSLDGSGGVVAADTALDLAVASRQAARALLGLGLGKGDRVLVLLPRVPAWYSAMLGAMRIGAVPVPSPNLLTSRDIAYRLRSAEAAAIVTDAGGAAKVDAITEELPALRHRLRWAPGAPPARGWLDYATLTEQAGDGATPLDPTGRDDPLVIFFTSGTVAYPKMVEQPQSYGLGHVATARFWHDLRPGDLHWTVSDTGWAKACWGGLFGQWHERATVVQVALGRPEAETILRIVAERGITSFCAPPTLYRLLVQADLGRHDLSALRHCTSAGEPLNPEVIRVWRSGTGGLTIYDGYGQSETTVLVANYRCLPVRPGSMGKPVPGYRVAVLDDGGGSVPAGTVGNVAVRAEPRPVGLFTGYLDDPQATHDAFRGDWYFTGDKAAVDADGYFWFEGRSDDVITSSAYRIGPFEVESALIEHPAVVEAAVVGRDDPARTQIVCAFVILAPGWEPSDELVRELQEHTKELTAPYKYPREVHFVAELPKTVSGKIRRSELREQLSAASGGPTP